MSWETLHIYDIGIPVSRTADSRCGQTLIKVIPALQILLMSDMAEFDDLRLELQKLKKKKQSTDVLGKVSDSHHSPGMNPSYRD